MVRVELGLDSQAKWGSSGTERFILTALPQIMKKLSVYVHRDSI